MARGQSQNVPVDSSRVFYRRLAHLHPRIEYGEGVYLYDSAGKRYLDGSGGAAVVNLGHGVKDITMAMSRQAAEVAFVHGTMFTTAALEALSERLAALVPIENPRAYYLTSGSEATETAIKFARQVQLARGEPNRTLVISRWGSYHGATLGALAVTGKPKMRQLFTPLFQDQPHIPPVYCYRCPFGATYPSCDLACAQALETEILIHGPDLVAAFIAESVGGATLGAVVPPEGYWEKITHICNKYGVLLIVDEVMAGIGRTGRWFGIEHYNADPDILTLGKGITGGYFPLSVTVVRSADVEAVQQVYGDFIHGGTYSHHAVGAACGLATLDYIAKHDLITRAAETGYYLSQLLEERLRELPCIGEVRGVGMLWGVEFVADKETKAPFPPEAGFNRRVCDLAFELGVILYPGAGGVDGARGDHLLVAPPFIISRREIAEMVNVLRESVVAVWEEM